VGGLLSDGGRGRLVSDLMTRMGGPVSRQEVDFSTIYNFCCYILNEGAQGNVVGGMVKLVK
jgi:hypothetical protein